MRREQLFVHICALFAHFCVAQAPTKPPKKTNTQKTPSDGNCSTMLICVFVYLCIHQQNHSLSSGSRGKLKSIKWRGEFFLYLFFNQLVIHPTISSITLSI